MFKKFYKNAFDSIEPPKALLDELLSRAESKAENKSFVYDGEIKKSKIIKFKRVYKYSACIAAVIAAAMLVTAIPLLKISDNNSLIGYENKQKDESSVATSKKQKAERLKEETADKGNAESRENSETAASNEKCLTQNIPTNKRKNTENEKDNKNSSSEVLEGNTPANKKKEDVDDAVKQLAPNGEAAVFSLSGSSGSSGSNGSSENSVDGNAKIASDVAAIQSENGLRNSGTGFFGKEVSANEVCDILGINIDDISLPDGVSYPDKIFVQTDDEGKPMKEGCGIYFSGSEKSGGIYYETAENEDFSAPNGEYVRKIIKKDGYILTVECFGFTTEETENLLKSIQKER